VIVAVVSDTHLPRESRRLPEECVRRLGAADLILHAGDHSSLAAGVSARGRAVEPELVALPT